MWAWALVALCPRNRYNIANGDTSCLSLERFAKQKMQDTKVGQGIYGMLVSTAAKSAGYSIISFSQVAINCVSDVLISRESREATKARTGREVEFPFAAIFSFMCLLRISLRRWLVNQAMFLSIAWLWQKVSVAVSKSGRWFIIRTVTKQTTAWTIWS